MITNVINHNFTRSSPKLLSVLTMGIESNLRKTIKSALIFVKIHHCRRSAILKPKISQSLPADILRNKMTFSSIRLHLNKNIYIHIFPYLIINSTFNFHSNTKQKNSLWIMIDFLHKSKNIIFFKFFVFHKI